MPTQANNFAPEHHGIDIETRTDVRARGRNATATTVTSAPASVLIQASASHIPLRGESVQCVVTSPPYWGLRLYAGEQREWWPDGWYGALSLEPTPDLYVEHMVAVFREVRRVLRKDGTCWVNLGDSYAANGTTGGGSPVDKRTDGRMSYEGDKVRGREPEARRAGDIGLKAKDLVGIPWRVAFALQADGWWLRSDIVWSKPNPMPESVTDRPTKSHEYVFLLTKSERYYYDADAIREPAEYGRREQPKATWARTGNADNDPIKVAGTTLGNDPAAGRNARSVWNIATQPYAGAHFATFPEALAERCILAGSSGQSMVLDPFNGSGTTGRVAITNGRAYVGLDISREYLTEQAIARIDPLAGARQYARIAEQIGGEAQGVMQL